MNKLSNIDKGYIAGLIDGEGTLTISKHKQYNRKIEAYQYRSFIWIFNTDIKMLEYVKDMCGVGSITVNKNDGIHKICYTFRIMSLEDSIYFLEQIQDVLITKKDRCEILLEFLYSRKANKIKNHCSKPYTEHEINLHKSIKILNKR